MRALPVGFKCHVQLVPPPFAHHEVRLGILSDCDALCLRTIACGRTHMPLIAQVLEEMGVGRGPAGYGDVSGTGEGEGVDG